MLTISLGQHSATAVVSRKDLDLPRSQLHERLMQQIVAPALAAILAAQLKDI